MSYAAISFSQLPRIGFAHHFYTEKYNQVYKGCENSLEIVYFEEGAVNATFYGKSFKIAPGSVVLIFRNAPFKLSSVEDGLHRHCCIQLQMEYDVTILDDDEQPPQGHNGLLLPLILPPCAETEMIKKELYTIVSNVGVSREDYELSAVSAALGILAQLDHRWRRQTDVKSSSGELWEYRIKQYVTAHIQENITLESVAEALGRTPNYLNSVFRDATGNTICRYINSEKVRIIAEMMKFRGMSFKTACAIMSITDVAYGYRLFKQHTGLTTRAYLSGEHRIKQKNSLF